LHGGIFVEHRRALGLADLLDHHVLGRLGSNASELRGVQRLLAALGENIAGIAIDRDDDPAFLAELLLRRKLHGRLDAGENDLAVDVLEMLHLIDNANEVGALHTDDPSPAAERLVGGVCEVRSGNVSARPGQITKKVGFWPTLATPLVAAPLVLDEFG